MAALSQIVGGGTQNYIEVYRLMNLGTYRSNWQNLTEATLQPVVWNTVKNYNNIPGVSLANNNVSLPAGQYQYEIDIQFFDPGADANRAVMVGLSASGDPYPNLLVPLRGTNTYSDYSDYTTQCLRSGQFNLESPQSVAMVIAVAYAGTNWASDLYVWCAPYYSSDGVGRWSQSGTTQLSAQVGTLKLWKLR